jgi:thioredoxin-related protein
MLISAVSLSQESEDPFFETPYDEAVDPFAQLNAAKRVAMDEDKLILLDVGGEWCICCHRLDDFFKENPEVAAYLTANYVPVKINYSVDNKNETFLATLPPIEGYPHIFVLDAKGALVHSQNTGDLEEGKGHSKEKIMAFLKKWAEPQ